MEHPDPHQLPDETIKLGRRELARLRQQLGTPVNQPPDVDRRPTQSPPRTQPDDGQSADRMAAEMAAGAERDRLEARIQQLELEVAQLRTALANVLEAAATGLTTDRQTSTDGEAADRQ